MAIPFTSNGWYIVRVDTGIGEQYAAIEFKLPFGVTALAWKPLDGTSSHFKALAGGPGATAEEAWALWRASLPLGHTFT